MMIVSLATASLFVYSINHNSGANDRAIANSIAQQRVEALRTLPYTDADLDATAGTTVTEMAYDGAGASRTFNVTTTITNDTTTLKTITVTVTPVSASTAWAAIPVTVMTRRASIETGDYVQ